MTRPMYEPSDANIQGNLGYRVRQLERRPAQPPTATQVVHLYAWNYTSDNTIPNETWTQVAGIGGTDGFYEEVEYTTGLSGMSYDMEAGQITMSADGMYDIQGWAQFWEDAQVDDEMRIVAINIGSSRRFIQSHRFDIDMGSIAAVRLPVAAFVGVTASTTAYLEVWQNSGGDLTLRDAQILVRQFEVAGELTVETGP